MEAIKKQVNEIQAAWSEVYKAMRATPTAWQPHLPGFFAEQIDEVVSTISQWLGKVDPPEGFKPAFHLAQGLVTTSLPQLLATVKNLQKGEYNYLPIFVNGLNQILSALHSMVVYSSKYDAKHIAADLAAQLAESLSLLGTAQSELKKKAELLDASTDIAKDTEKRAAAINDLEQKAVKLVQDTTTSFAKLSSDIQNQSTRILGDTNANVVKLTAALEAVSTKTSADSRDDFATDPLGYADYAFLKKERFQFIVEQPPDCQCGSHPVCACSSGHAFPQLMSPFRVFRIFRG